jgi:hypothetical protein
MQRPGYQDSVDAPSLLERERTFVLRFYKKKSKHLSTIPNAEGSLYVLD